MRTAIFLFAILCIVASCANNKTEEKPAVIKGKTLSTLPVPPERIKGTYIGDFKGSPIAITLNYVSNNHASGYNVHKGLTRNVSGTVEASKDGLHLVLEEPSGFNVRSFIKLSVYVVGHCSSSFAVTCFLKLKLASSPFLKGFHVPLPIHFVVSIIKSNLSSYWLLPGSSNT